MNATARHALHRLVMIALVLQTTACVGAVDTAGPAPAAEGGDGVIADVLPVSCADGVLSLGAERARVHADGLHVELAEVPDPGMSVEFASPDETDLHDIRSRGAAYDTGLTVIHTVAPGTVLVRCYPDDGPRHMLSITEDDEAMNVDIIDDGGHWVEPEQLDCGGAVEYMVPDYGAEPAPAVEPVEPLADAVDTTGRDGGEVRTHGYPEAATRWASVVDGGRTVSRSTYVRNGTSWRLIGTVSCG